MTPRIPHATYRLQLGPELNFRDARALVPYLRQLGVSHLYTSPLLQARAASSHGYDVVDPMRIEPKLGGGEALEQLAAELHDAGMGLLADVVPNHMAADESAPWWSDLLEHGTASAHAGVFDLLAPAERLRLPILARPYADALAQRELRAVLDHDGIALRCGDRVLPTDPTTWEPLLAELGLDELCAPPNDAEAAGGRGGRISRARRMRERLLARCGEVAELRARLSSGLDDLAPDALHRFVRSQPYQPVHWRLAAERSSYRRFFDIGDLVGVRVEDPDVFRATHALLLRLHGDGVIDAFRLDHVDGLADPLGYLQLLRAHAPEAYVIVEKILADGEALPADWPVDGTTGYEFDAEARAVFVTSGGHERLRRIWRAFTGARIEWPELRTRMKLERLAESFAGELDHLDRLLERIAGASPVGVDLSPAARRSALAAITACLAPYRTYLRGEEAGATDREALDTAFAAARALRPELGDAVWRFLRRVLGVEADPLPEESDARREFVTRWQQLTSAVQAKGVEDTALYRWTPLLSLNEVGADPDPPAGRLGVAAFHDAQARARRRHGLLATSTHDSKRSEDVRCRLHVLADLPETWRRALIRFRRRNAGRHRVAGGAKVPDAREEYLLYQTLAGAWPLDPAELPGFPARVVAYMTKAGREAKRNTSWLAPDEARERALAEFVEELLDPERSAGFLGELTRLHARLAPLGAWNSLALLALKLAAPGVPDFYQGCELWNFRLVDPDNRAPVDFARRRELLEALAGERPRPALARELLRHWPDGRIKLFVTMRGLALRQALPSTLLDGEYVPLRTAGSRSGNLCAFARTDRDGTVLCAVPAQVGALTRGRPPVGEAVWRDTEIELPDGFPALWRDAISGHEFAARDGRIRAGEMLSVLPVVLAQG